VAQAGCSFTECVGLGSRSRFLILQTESNPIRGEFGELSMDCGRARRKFWPRVGCQVQEASFAR
jgi:hypothetical protein